MHNVLKGTFEKEKVLLPVISIVSEDQTTNDVAIAYKSGADGVIIADTFGANPLFLNRIYTSIKRIFDDYWIGLNYLSQNITEAIEHTPDELQGLYVHNLFTHHQARGGAFHESNRKNMRDIQLWNGLYFGAIELKGKLETKEVKEIARLTIPNIDVLVVNSGNEHEPPLIENIKALKNELGCHSLSISSGINEENIQQFLPFVDCFIVDSSIKKDNGELDRRKVEQLEKIVHG